MFLDSKVDKCFLVELVRKFNKENKENSLTDQGFQLTRVYHTKNNPPIPTPLIHNIPVIEEFKYIVGM